jgi:hypothetical protein
MVDPILENAVLMLLASELMLASEPNAIKAAAKAYSIRFWPDSSLSRLRSALKIMAFTMLLLEHFGNG